MLAILQLHGLDPRGHGPPHGAEGVKREVHEAADVVCDEHRGTGGALLHKGQGVAVSQPDGVEAAGADLGEVRELHLLDHAMFGGHHKELLLREVRDRQHSCDISPLGDVEDGADRGPLSRALRLGDLIRTNAIHHPRVTEEQHMVVVHGVQDVLHSIVLPEAGSHHALPTARLHLEGVLLHAFYVAPSAERHKARLVGQDVLRLQDADRGALLDGRPPGRPELLQHIAGLRLYDFQQALPAA
mmetsp:Transcript_22088/g.61314  ORF Transcript_22088/g.61314 Transcript_22088/m.61314 type:complete len:243 (+) Transcript_22088:648-1376(+)